MPNKIDSNATGLSIAEETSLKTLPGTPVWYELEPNSYSDFGGDTKTVARAPINAGRQRKRGVVTGQDAGGGFNSDLTQNNLFRPLQGFFFADAHEKPDTQPVSTAAAITITSVSATQYLAAAGLAVFLANHLVLGSGFGVAANNGLKVVTASAAGSITAPGVAAEAAPPAAARVQVVGIRGAAGDITLTAAASGVTLGSTALDFTTLGLSPGEWIAIGGDAVANQYATAANKGYGRIASIAAHAMVLDETTFVAVTDAGAGKLIDLYFGKFLRNEKTASLQKRRTYNLERTLGNDGNGVQSEYLEGSIPNEATFNFPLEDKATVDLSFVSCKHTPRDGTSGPKAGTRVASAGEAAFNTTSDIFRLHVAPAVAAGGNINNADTFGYVNDAKISIKNGVTGTKALGTLGNVDATAGDFEVGGSVTALFSTVAAVVAIRNNTDLEFNAILAARNAGCVFDMPLLGLGGGKLNVEKDKEITIPVDMAAAESKGGFTMSLTQFPYLPSVLMPA